MNAKKIFFISLLIVGLTSCSTVQNAPNWQKGAALGGALGAGAGAIIGHQVDGHTGGGALIGGAAGALAGGLIGKQLDKQQAELSQVAEVQRPSENELVVVLREKILFDVNEYALKPGAEDNLAKIAEVVAKYPDFDVMVEGHTDSTGTETYNQWLSEKRAGAVTASLASKGVPPARINAIGYGELRPVSTNDTAEGRQQNRRVELHITPSETAGAPEPVSNPAPVQ